MTNYLKLSINEKINKKSFFGVFYPYNINYPEKNIPLVKRVIFKLSRRNLILEKIKLRRKYMITNYPSELGRKRIIEFRYAPYHSKWYCVPQSKEVLLYLLELNKKYHNGDIIKRFIAYYFGQEISEKVMYYKKYHNCNNYEYVIVKNEMEDFIAKI